VPPSYLHFLTFHCIFPALPFCPRPSTAITLFYVQLSCSPSLPPPLDMLVRFFFFFFSASCFLLVILSFSTRPAPNWFPFLSSSPPYPRRLDKVILGCLLSRFFCLDCGHHGQSYFPPPFPPFVCRFFFVMFRRFGFSRFPPGLTSSIDLIRYFPPTDTRGICPL